jgi:hypothetical protein
MALSLMDYSDVYIDIECVYNGFQLSVAVGLKTLNAKGTLPAH